MKIMCWSWNTWTSASDEIHNLGFSSTQVRKGIKQSPLWRLRGRRAHGVIVITNNFDVNNRPRIGKQIWKIDFVGFNYLWGRDEKSRKLRLSLICNILKRSAGQNDEGFKTKLMKWHVALKDSEELVLQNYRRMPSGEKRWLGTPLTQLSPIDLNKELLIVAEDNPNFQATTGEAYCIFLGFTCISFFRLVDFFLLAWTKYECGCMWAWI